MIFTINIFGVFLCLLSVILAAILAYYWCQFYNLKQQQVYIKRRGDIVTAYTICAIITLLFVYPSLILTYWEIVPIDKNGTFYLILNSDIDVLIIPFYYAATFLLVIRLWLVYYDVGFANASLNVSWKACISSDIATLKKERWYMKHKSTLGNISYITYRFIIIYIIWTTCTMIAVYVYTFGVTQLRIGGAFASILYLGAVIFIMILPRKIPDFSDNFYVCKEAKLMAFYLRIAVVTYIACYIINVVVGQSVITWMLIEFVGVISAFICPFISTFWVLKQVRSKSIIVPDSSFQVDPDTPATPDLTQDLELEDVLGREDSFSAFMQHLIREFSMENLLALIEFVQFKNLVISTFNIDKRDIGDSFDFVFPVSVPVSDIVGVYNGRTSIVTRIADKSMSNLEEDQLLSFKIKAHRLYSKYVRNGCELQLNLPIRVRGELDGLMGSYDLWIASDEFTDLQLVKMFDYCLCEVISLLRESKGRLQY